MCRLDPGSARCAGRPGTVSPHPLAARREPRYAACRDEAMNKPSPTDTVLGLLASAFERIAVALDRLAPPAAAKPDFAASDAFIWHAEGGRLEAVKRVNRV